MKRHIYLITKSMIGPIVSIVNYSLLLDGPLKGKKSPIKRDIDHRATARWWSVKEEGKEKMINGLANKS